VTKLRVITSPSGARFTVADEHADKFGGLVKDLEAAGIRINPNASGGYNPRNIRGSNKPSNHAFGRAIDVNWDENPMGQPGKINPEVARSIAAKYGMTWGGDWKNRPDPMHFEVAGVPNVPVSQRAFTRVAGVQQTEPSTTGTPQPMASYKNVGGQPSVMAPEEALRRQQLGQMLMRSGQDQAQQPMRHWAQALGSILNTGVGSYQAGQGARGMAEGQQAGNQALSQLLMGGDASAAMANPYSAEQALRYQMENSSPAAKQQQELRAAQIEKMRSETEAANAERERQKLFDSMIMGGGVPAVNTPPVQVPSQGVGRFAQPNLIPQPQQQGGSIQEMFAGLPPNVQSAARAALASGDREGAVKIITQNSVPPKKTVTEMKTILDAENQAISLDNSIKTLGEAEKLISEGSEKSGTAGFEGFGAGVGGWLGSRLPDAVNPIDKTRAKATDEYGNIMNMEAISAMSEKLKGATTDRELAEFQRILSDPTQPREIRRRVIGRMKRLLEQQSALAKRRIEELRTGTYFRNPNGVAPSSGMTGATDLGDGFTIEVEQ